MAVYVVLSFDNDDDAKTFVKNTLEEEEYFKRQAQVVGVFKKPTQFCQCPGSKTAKSFTRGQKFGWWVCSKCKRPTQMWASRDGWWAFMGTNLLPRELTQEYRGRGWTSDAVWSFLLPPKEETSAEETSIVPSDLQE